jgi:hypothetical protein
MTIGRFLRKPLPALAAGVASHAVLDYLPHRDSWHPVWRVIDGGLTAAVFVFALSVPRRDAAFIGAVGGLLPDVENIPRRNGAFESKKVFPSHRFRHETRPGNYGVAVELLAASIALAICVVHIRGGSNTNRPG